LIGVCHFLRFLCCKSERNSQNAQAHLGKGEKKDQLKEKPHANGFFFIGVVLGLNFLTKIFLFLFFVIFFFFHSFLRLLFVFFFALFDSSTNDGSNSSSRPFIFYLILLPEVLVSTALLTFPTSVVIP
jgi:hypothetical protein